MVNLQNTDTHTTGRLLLQYKTGKRNCKPLGRAVTETTRFFCDQKDIGFSE